MSFDLNSQFEVCDGFPNYLIALRYRYDGRMYAIMLTVIAEFSSKMRPRSFNTIDRYIMTMYNTVVKHMYKLIGMFLYASLLPSSVLLFSFMSLIS